MGAPPPRHTHPRVPAGLPGVHAHGRVPHHTHMGGRRPHRAHPRVAVAPMAAGVALRVAGPLLRARVLRLCTGDAPLARASWRWRMGLVALAHGPPGGALAHGAHLAGGVSPRRRMGQVHPWAPPPPPPPHTREWP